MNRTNYAVKNMKMLMISKLLTFVISFISRTVFIRILGSEYLGINSLYTDLLTILSFAELGFGSALTFLMYKPIVEDDDKKIAQLLNYYRKVYRIIALVIFCLGLLVLPFLPYLVKGNYLLNENDLRLYFIIFLFNTIITYFVSYKYSYAFARQQMYITTKLDIYVNIITVFIQTIILIITKSFFLYLLSKSIILLISRFIISNYLNKLFPILTNPKKEELDVNDKKILFREIKGLVIHQFSSIAVHQTDNIIISATEKLGIITVGLINNYNMLINGVLGFVQNIFSSVTAGFGNLAAESNNEKFKKVFDTANFISFWIYSFVCIAFYILIPKFISIWLGDNFLIDKHSFALIIINCYLQGQSTVYNDARIAKGNFNKDKWLALLQAIVNLIISIVCVNIYGLLGVYIGTIASRLVYVIFRPYSTYKFLFGISSYYYYLDLIKYFIIALVLCVISVLITNLVLIENSIVDFIFACLVVITVPNIIIITIFRKNDRYKDVKIRLESLIWKK